MKTLLKKAVPPSLRRYAAERKRSHARAALKRISARGVTVKTVIDVGASDGRWSLAAMDYFPDANYLLVEANPVHQPALETFCRVHAQAEYELAAASDKTGTLRFDGSVPFGGSADPENPETAIEVKAVRLDDFAAPNGPFEAPFFLKVDTHGQEVPILEGAENVLAKASLVVIDEYCYQLTPTSLLFDEMVAYMRAKGFGVVDMSDPLWRPQDKCFWQIDLYFEPLTMPYLQKNTYV